MRQLALFIVSLAASSIICHVERVKTYKVYKYSWLDSSFHFIYENLIMSPNRNAGLLREAMVTRLKISYFLAFLVNLACHSILACVS